MCHHHADLILLVDMEKSLYIAAYFNCIVFILIDLIFFFFYFYFILQLNLNYCICRCLNLYTLRYFSFNC
jgi:hypothetical protein